MTLRDLARIPLSSTVVLFAFSLSRLWRHTSHVIVCGLVLIGLACFVAPASWAADPPPRPGFAKDVYFNAEGPISGPPAPRLTEGAYPKIPLPGPFGESRVVMWVLGQQHLYFGAFVLGALFWILGLELRGLLARRAEASQRADRAAQDILNLVVLAVSGAAISGALLLLAFLSLYPDFAKYLFGLFRPFVWLYGLLFVTFSLTIYLYYYLWQRMAVGFSKWLHAVLGVLVNVIGNVIMMVGNSWGTFMMSPAGVDQRGRFLGDFAHVLHNPLWGPFNAHRFVSHLIFGAVVIAAYSGYQALRARSADRRDFYGWMSRTAFLSLVFVLFLVSFGGYLLKLDIYTYRQQLGMILSGGLLTWHFQVLVLVMAIVFLTVNYYLWQQIGSSPDGRTFRSHSILIFAILAVSAMVYATPRFPMMTAGDLAAIGGLSHPVVFNYGAMSSKQAAVHVMMVVTMWSFLMCWRCRYDVNRGSSKLDVILTGLFVASVLNALALGIIGFYIPANVRVGLTVPMVMTTLHVVILGALFTFAKTFRAQPVSPRVSGYPARMGYFSVLATAGAMTWLMGLGGYLRSAVRVFWHALEISRDYSPWAFTHAVGFAANLITFNALLFWGVLLVLIWLKQCEPSSVQNREVLERKVSRVTETPSAAVT